MTAVQSTQTSDPTNKTKENDELLDLNQLFTAQQQAYASEPYPELTQRLALLKQLKRQLLAYKKPLCQALHQDYGNRSQYDTLLSDILPCVQNINYTIKHLKRWLKPSKRHAGLLLMPAKLQVHYQPLGVVGIIVPWNFPVMLSIGPLIAAIAAGNRAMLKLSEFTPQTNQVLRELLAKVFTPDYVAVVEGEANIAQAFSQLPFHHLLFTGSTAVGHHVMHAAADNLTPVTLELGGKSPVVIAPDVPLELAVERLIFGKCLNAGQICVAPDYVLLPQETIEEFISLFKQKYRTLYPHGITGQDFASIINQRQFDRLYHLLQDAETQGASIHPCHEPAIDPEGRRLAPHLITNVSDQMAVMEQEIFGPLLPLIPYQSQQQAIEFINQRPRPLALYVMSFDPSWQQAFIYHTHSGGIAINDTVFHVAADDAPFGGIGPSGMGHYHGHEGFLTFSKAKTVLTKGKFSSGKFILPPYGRWLQRLILSIFLR
ncbi:coniferyl aldehyde dehydrogenase [Photobacterium damselae]|uniref:coniferyl aldehyde dehydrogenase n=1 Tax=Photobacterium damselae TaxID=38293 RepID=UPI002542C461